MTSNMKLAMAAVGGGGRIAISPKTGGYEGAKEEGPPLPVANFSGTPVSGAATLVVPFTDLSTNAPTSWSWRWRNPSGTNVWTAFNFPNDQNPTESFPDSGLFDIRLTVMPGSDEEIKIAYISVEAV